MAYADFRDAALEKNIQAVNEGYEQTRVYDVTGKPLGPREGVVTVPP